MCGFINGLMDVTMIQLGELSPPIWCAYVLYFTMNFKVLVKVKLLL